MDAKRIIKYLFIESSVAFTLTAASGLLLFIGNWFQFAIPWSPEFAFAFLLFLSVPLLVQLIITRQFTLPITILQYFLTLFILVPFNFVVCSALTVYYIEWLIENTSVEYILFESHGYSFLFIVGYFCFIASQLLGMKIIFDLIGLNTIAKSDPSKKRKFWGGF